jgi:carbonic anhydrase
MKLRIEFLLTFIIVITTALITTSCSEQPGQQKTKADSHPQVFTEAMQDTLKPVQALNRLKKGNDRFVEGDLKYKDYRQQFEETAAKGQFPHSTVFTCVDSRSAGEQFFDVGIGEIFNIRIAGNALNEDVLGSMEFATKVAGSKVIAIVGHTSCGAVKGAIDNAELGHLTGLVKKIQPAMEQVPDTLGERNSKNAAFVNAVTRRHVQNVMDDILEKSEVISKQVEAGDIKLVGGMHNLATGEVTFFE